MTLYHQQPNPKITWTQEERKHEILCLETYFILHKLANNFATSCFKPCRDFLVSVNLMGNAAFWWWTLICAMFFITMVYYYNKFKCTKEELEYNKKSYCNTSYAKNYPYASPNVGFNKLQEIIKSMILYMIDFVVILNIIWLKAFSCNGWVAKDK
jgi:cbb3-type cytochrome oxidase subunit 3